MKKVKMWLKEHKKEIIVGTLAAGGTAIYFLSKKKKVGVSASLDLVLRFLDYDEKKEDDFDWRGRNRVHTSIDLGKLDLTLSDLGKLGELLREKVPMITEDVKVDHLSAHYSRLKK